MSILKISLSDISNQLLKELKEKFGKTAEIEITVNEPNSPVILEEDKFWEIIDALDWTSKTGEEILESAVKKLASLPVVYIYLFADLLAEKVWQLNTTTHAENFKKKEDYLSVDDFLYARCAVVAEGKEYYEKVLNGNLEMPTEIIFEPLLQLPAKAYHEKTGKQFQYTPTNNIETSPSH